MTEYQLHVHAVADPRSWVVAVPKLKLILSVPNLGEMAPATRNAIARITGTEPTSFRLAVHLDPGGAVARAIIDGQADPLEPEHPA